MTNTSTVNPKLRSYLRDLEVALSVLPRDRAGELREQITSHLFEALPESPTDKDISVALAELGPVETVVSEAVRGVRVGVTRRLFVRMRRIRWWWWVLLGVLFSGGSTLTGFVVSWETSTPLGFYGGLSAWWGPNVHHEVDSSANGQEQSTIAVEPGKTQGFVVQITNPGPWAQTVLGVASTAAGRMDDPPPVTGPGGGPEHITVSSACGRDDCSHLYSLTYRSTVTVPSGQTRLLRVLWRPKKCWMAPGFVGVVDQVSLKVQVGSVTRTEVIQLPEGFALAGTSSQGCH
jgi:hypothetical protein